MQEPEPIFTKPYIGKTPEEFKQDYPNRDIRVLKPDSVHTMDYRPTRINLYVDDDGLITSIRRG